MNSRAELTAGVEQQTSTAWKLAAYREELHACGFAPSVAADLVLIAARNATEWTVGPLFVARAEPPAPIMRIENHELGSPLDLAMGERLVLEKSTGYYVQPDDTCDAPQCRGVKS